MSKRKNEDLIIDDQSNPLALLEGLEFDGPDDSDMWTDQYPFIQWNNSEKKWEFPLKHWAGTQMEQDYELIEVDHGQEIEHGFLLDTIHISVVAWRYTWECQGDDGKMVYSLKPDFDSGQRWSKRYNFLCLVQETGDDDPVIITAKGYTGEFLYNALNQGRKRILKLARHLTGRQFPGYLFWLPVTAGEKRLVGKKDKSAIYPPAPVIQDISELDTDGLSNLLNSLYVGDELKGLLTGYLYQDGQQWASENTDRLQVLPAGGDNQSSLAEILPGDILLLPDLSNRKRSEWIECAMSIPGLFDHRSHASNAFAKALRDRNAGGVSLDRQWDIWRADLERRWNEKKADDDAVQVEMMLQNGG